MRRILVTGGSGFIGSHTCYSLLENNYDLFVIDSLVNSNIKSIARIKKIFMDKKINISEKLKFFKGDLRNKRFIDSIFEKANEEKKPIEGVIHFAGLKAVSESVSEPLLYWENNVLGSLNLLRSMEENNCKIIVFSSSATVYGNANDDLLKESSKICPINPYGSTKLAVENLLNDISGDGKKEWGIAILRYFNPIGAHQTGLLGENPLQRPNNIFPIIINAAYENKPMKVFGKDWPTHDGTCIRDYIHVVDLADGHVKALNYLFEKERELITLNIGTGKGISVLKLIKTFQEINNVKVPFVFGKRREGDTSKLVADNSKAKNILNWFPRNSLEEMCVNGWKWKCLNPNGYIE